MWMKKILNWENQIHNFQSSSGSGTVNNYGSGSDFLTSYGSGSTSQKVTVPTVPVPVTQRCLERPPAIQEVGGSNQWDRYPRVSADRENWNW
jgi:hypothetical protein